MSILEDEKDMAGDPHRHTKSEGLKRLLRRRNRRMKTGANSGEKVYSWAEYSQVNFTPTGDRSSLGYGIVGFLAVFAFFLMPVIVGATSAIVDGKDLAGIISSTLVSILWFVLAGVSLAIPVAIIGGIYVALDGNNDDTRNKLITTADKIRAKQDEDANRAK